MSNPNPASRIEQIAQQYSNDDWLNRGWYRQAAQDIAYLLAQVETLTAERDQWKAAWLAETNETDPLWEQIEKLEAALREAEATRAQLRAAIRGAVADLRQPYLGTRFSRSVATQLEAALADPPPGGKADGE